MTEKDTIQTDAAERELRTSEGFVLRMLGDLFAYYMLGDDWVLQVGERSEKAFSESKDNLRHVPVGLVLAARPPAISSVRSSFAKALGGSCDSREVDRIIKLIDGTGYHLEPNDV